MIPKSKLKNASPDLKARFVIMASYLYYDESLSIMTDAQFDQLCIDVCNNWSKLSPFRQWALGDDPLELLATGSCVKLTYLSVHAARSCYRKYFGEPADPFREKTMAKHSKEFGVRWSPISG